MAYRGLDGLFPRPPTPPKDLSSDPLEPFRPSSQFDTPTTPSIPAADYFTSILPQPAFKKRKRVNFNLTPVTSDAPSSSPSLLEAPLSGGLTRHTPPSRHSRRDLEPVKSILKVRKQHGLLSELGLGSDKFNINLDFSAPSFFFKIDKIRMLEQTCRQLAEGHKSERLDAYQSLTTAMKKHDDMPKLDEFTERVPAYIEYVLRDLRTRKGDDHRDAQLAVEALKLATILTWRNPPTLTIGAKAELLDWCIETLKDATASKVITNNTLCLLTYQTFNKTLTRERVQKILKTIMTIDSRISGIQVKVLRLDIYKKLSSQCTQHMVSCASLWLGPLIEALLSDKMEVSTKALPCAREIAISLGCYIEVSKELERLLNLPIHGDESQDTNVENGETESKPLCYADIMVEKLRSTAKDKARSETVPQIWSVLVLFLQRRRSVITRAPHKQKLLGILQYCLNKVPLCTKSRAVIAWQDLIYTLHQDMHKDRQVLDLLGLLFLRLFQRFDGDKAMNDIESTYCTYLYYAMWPKATHETITWVWKNKVSKIMSRNDPKNQIRPAFVLRLLAAMFGSETQVPWDAKKVLQAAPLQPEDIPRIDPKWVAANLGSIFEVLGDYLNIAGGAQNDAAYSAWNTLNKCVVEARTHEIRPSAATMSAMASFLTNIIKYGSQILADSGTEHQSPASISHISRLLIGTLDSFGAIPCNEKVLLVDEDNVVHSQDSSKNTDASDDKCSALDLTISMLMSDCVLAGKAPEASLELMELLIRRKLEPFSSRCKKLQMLAELSQEAICDDEHAETGGQKTYCLKHVMWREICNSLNDILDNYSPLQTASDSQSFGADFQQAVTILLNGVNHGSSGTWFRSFTLLVSKARAVLVESPKLALLDAVFDPVAHGVVQKLEGPNAKKGRRVISRKLVGQILSRIEWHDENDTYEQAQKSLWGAAPAVSRKNLNDMNQNVHRLFSELLNMDTRKVGPSQVVGTVHEFITGCPTGSIWQLLQTSGKLLGIWLQAKSQLSIEPIVWSSAWSGICKKIKTAWADRPTDHMVILEPILLPGLVDSNPSIATGFVALWNDCVGALSNVEVSPELSLTLRHIAEAHDISLNCLAASSIAQGPVHTRNGAKTMPTPITVQPSTLRNSPSRRDWVLAKSPRPVPTITLTPEGPPPVQSPECIQEPVQTPSHSPLTRGLVPTVEDEMPSSPPELPQVPTSEDDPVQEGVEQTLSMSDEIQHMDSSPTPLPRGRPCSEGRSASIYDFPDSSPLTANQRVARSDPVQSNTKRANSKKRRQPKSASKSISSKHFPITIDDEDAGSMETPVEQNAIERIFMPLSDAQAQEQTALPDQAAEPQPASAPPAQVEKRAATPIMITEPEVIDLEALIRSQSKSAKRKRAQANDNATGEPVKKRGRGRPRKNPLPPSSSQENPTPAQSEMQPQKRGRGRPRKNTNIPPTGKTATRSTPVPRTDDDFDDDDSTIEVLTSPAARAQSRARSTAPTRKQDDHVLVPSSTGDVEKDQEPTPTTGQAAKSPGAVAERVDRAKSVDSVEFVKASFVIDDQPANKSSGKLKVEVPQRRSSRRLSNEPLVALVEKKRGRKRQRQETENNEQVEAIPDEDDMAAEKPVERALRSPSSQLQVDVATPTKKRRVSPAKETDGSEREETPATPRSPLSDTALKILNNLRGMVGKLQDAWMGRNEAREIQRALHQMGTAVLDAEKRTEEAEQDE